MPQRLAISMGDFNGIGPEIILKTLNQLLAAGGTPVVIGHHRIFEYYADRLDLQLSSWHGLSDPGDIQDETINFYDLEEGADIAPEPGTLSEQAGRLSMQAVAAGINSCMNGHTDALVTAPISKEAINRADYRYPGHTEFLAEKTNTDDFMMMLVHETLRVGLVTIHIPVGEITARVNQPAITRNIRLMHAALAGDFGIARPRLAVLGLNPHAGDGGIIGREEIDIIGPAIAAAQAEGIDLHGPFPADGFFGNRKYEQYDGVLAMYHDQGLIPFKTLSFGGGVNVTAGLPMVRTSPDHGTAFDIAGDNIANPSSFHAAATLALTLSHNRSTTAPSR